MDNKDLRAFFLEHGIVGIHCSEESECDPIEALGEYIRSRDQQIALAAQIKGMEKAKSRVLRRTEIPADARNPTRDFVVILGEEIAGFIDQDIASLKEPKEKK